ncbi:MAG TPA: lysylphosphatidylglycerol synthase domain-containing protein [Rhizomicrobium sp.]|nr:lysylphosphatidylglycerol synthase domain-containing protein [Rhizomicrobium sp.]
MRFGLIFAALLGVALAVWMIGAVGVQSVLSATLAVGWGGFVALCASGAVLFVVLGRAWFELAPQHGKAGFADFVWSRAIRECSGELLPFSQLGGIVIGARALKLRGVQGSLAVASSIVDVTVEMVAQIVFVLAGLVFLLTRHEAANAALIRNVAAGVAAAIVIATAFFVFQQRGVATVARWSGRWFPGAGPWLGKLRESLAEIHASPARLASSFLAHLGGWIGTALWAWLAVYLIGHRISFALVFTIEAILCAIRAAAIIVPGAIGVQEASYALIGPLLGLAAPAAIALSLLKRARDVALGVPLLLVWQFAEGRHAWKGGGSVR